MNAEWKLFPSSFALGGANVIKWRWHKNSLRSWQCRRWWCGVTVIIITIIIMMMSVCVCMSMLYDDGTELLWSGREGSMKNIFPWHFQHIIFSSCFKLGIFWWLECELERTVCVVNFKEFSTSWEIIEMVWENVMNEGGSAPNHDENN